MRQLLSWIRMRLGLCQLGQYGCNRRPAGMWRPFPSDSWTVRLCAQCKAELEIDLGPLENWMPAR